jgi:hypothetical protein
MSPGLRAVADGFCERIGKVFEAVRSEASGFKDRDLYVWCANASDGILTAHPYELGQGVEGHRGQARRPVRSREMQKATEGTIKEVTYWWPRPGSDKPLEKTTFYTKAGDQICGVGYYKGRTPGDPAALMHARPRALLREVDRILVEDIGQVAGCAARLVARRSGHDRLQQMLPMAR